MSIILRLGDCVAMVIARREVTKQSLEVIGKEKIATPPLVSRDDKNEIITQPLDRGIQL